MAHKVTRWHREKSRQRRNQQTSKSKSILALEPLENRVLLDVAGWWDELGWRSGSGGGITWDRTTEPGESQMVQTSDGDPVVFWIEGAFNEYVDQPVPYYWNMEGNIYARQYGGEDLGWWDLTSGSGDDNPIAYGSQLAVASGPDGQIVLVYNSSSTVGEISAMLWDGTDWQSLGTVSSNDNLDNANPSVVISSSGDIYVSYTAINDEQQEIIVKKFGYTYEEVQVGPPQNIVQTWIELVNPEIGNFGEDPALETGGVSNDLAKSFDSAIAVDNAGKPVVTWTSQKAQGNYEIYVRRWDGSDWNELGYESASDVDGDGLSGVSKDTGVSIQPDIAIADDGDVIVTWVNWADWKNYDNPATGGGKAGVFVKTLQSNTWVAYETGVSATGAGIAPSLGWYYSPTIITDTDGNPIITWQGFGAGERYDIDRDDSEDGTVHTPGLPGNADDESPIMAAYVSRFASSHFGLLEYSGNTSYSDRATPEDYLCWMPDVLLDADGNILLSYRWYDGLYDIGHHDSEIFVQQWDGSDWVEFGRGSNSNGNELLSWMTADGYDYDAFYQLGMAYGLQLGLIDYDNNSATAPDILAANGEHVYLYHSATDTWDGTTADIAYGKVFDLEGDPSYEYDVVGNPLLAYLDENGDPFVFQWTGGGWNLVGGGTAGDGIRQGRPFDESGMNLTNNVGISVQAGQNGTILVAYIWDNGHSDDIVCRYWDPNAGVWADAGDGVAGVGVTPKSSPLSVFYLSDYNGFTWEDPANTDNAPVSIEERPEDGDDADFLPDYVLGTWYTFTSGYPTDKEDLVVIGTGGDAGVNGTFVFDAATGTPTEDLPNTDPGLFINFVTDTDAPLYTGSLTGQFEYYFESYDWEDAFIIEFDYLLDASTVALGDGMELHVLLDGTDIPVDSIDAGVTTDFLHAMVDTSDSGITLTAGNHLLQIQVTTSSAAGTARLDNVGMYQRILSNGNIVLQDSFNENTSPIGDTWTFVPDTEDPDQTAGEYNINGGTLGNKDGALEIILGDGVHATANLQGELQTDFTLDMAGTVNIELFYQLVTGGDITAGKTLDLILAIDGQEITTLGDYRITGPNVEDDYQYLSVSSDVLAPYLTEGDHTLSIIGVLSGSAAAIDGIATVRFDCLTISAKYVTEQFNDDLDAADPLATDWSYVETANPAEAAGVYDANGGENGAGDGALHMTLGDGVGADANLTASFVYSFTGGAEVLIDLSYRLLLGNDILDDDTLDLILSIDGDDINRVGVYQVSGTDQDSGWVDLSISAFDLLGYLDYGNHTLSIRADLTNSAASAAGTGQMWIDNIVVASTNGYSQWENDHSGDTGNNHLIGPFDAANNPTYDFQECLHSQVFGIDGETNSQIYTVFNGMVQESGDIVVTFRYRLDTDNFNTNVYVLANDIAYPVTFPDWYFGSSTGWWDGDNNDPHYTTAQITIPGVTAGYTDISILLEMEGNSGETADLWIDDLSILMPQNDTDVVRPIVTLLPNRNFAVGFPNPTEEVEVHQSGVTDPHLSAPIALFEYYASSGLYDGYSTVSIFEYDVSSNEWEQYGNTLSSTTSCVLMDLGLSYPLPTNDIYQLSDLAIGPNGVEWILVENAAAEPVDLSSPADGIIDRFDAHPFLVGNPVPQWALTTTDLSLDVWRWQPYNDPLNITGSSEQWVNVPFTAETSDFAITNGQIISSGGQLLTISWNNRGDDGDYRDSGALRYQKDGTWGVLGTESIQNAENIATWSSTILNDMIMQPNGYPVVSYHMIDLYTDAVRTFRPASDLPDLEIAETSGIVDDDTLEFNTSYSNTVDQTFTISNSEDALGDLIIYSMDFGGLGTLSSNPYQIINIPSSAFPLILEPGEEIEVKVRLNAAGLPVGDYSSILLIHSNDANIDTTEAGGYTEGKHPFSRYYEVLLQTEIVNQAEVKVSRNEITFDDTVVSTSSTARTVTITNTGTTNLTISDWAFAGSIFSISKILVDDVQQGSVINGPGAGDDIVLAPESQITFHIVFTPDDTGYFSDILTIRTDDEEDTLVPIGLLGEGISNAAISITETSGTANDDLLEFGSVPFGEEGQQQFVIHNNGTTNLTINDIVLGVADNPITTNWAYDEWVLAPGGTFTVIVSYVPSSATNEIQELDTFLVVNTDDPEIRNYRVYLAGLGVPDDPIISLPMPAQASSVLLDKDEDDNVDIVNFGSVTLGIPATQSFTIKNIGGQLLTITGFELNPPLNSPFTILDPSSLPQSLAVNEELTVTIIFDPAVTGSSERTLRIFSDAENVDENNPYYSVLLTGIGTEQVLNVTVSDDTPSDGILSFGPVAVNQTSSQQTITLKNTGSNNLVITGWALTDGDTGNFTLETFVSSVTLIPGQQDQLTIYFTPNESRTFASEVTIYGENNSYWTVLLNGIGAAPGQASIIDSQGDPNDQQINFTLTNSDALNYREGQISVQTITIANNGGSALWIKDLDVTSTFFKIDPQAAPDTETGYYLVEAGQTLTVAIIFAPRSVYDSSSILTITTTTNLQDSGADHQDTITLLGKSYYVAQVGGVNGQNLTKILINDSNGVSIQIKLTGGGYANVRLAGGGFSGDIEEIELIGTTDKSVLTVTAPKTGSYEEMGIIIPIKNYTTTIGSITGGTVKNIIFKNVIMSSEEGGINLTNLAGKLQLGNIEEGADITIGQITGKGAKIVAGTIGDDTEIVIGGDVASFTADSFGDSSFQANNVNKLAIRKGSADPVQGSFQIDGLLKNFDAKTYDFTGAINAGSIDKITLGSMANAVVNVQSELKSLTVQRDVIDSLICGGYSLDLGTDGKLGGTGLEADTFAQLSNGSLASIKIGDLYDGSTIATGMAPTITPTGYADFFTPLAGFTPGSIGTVSLGSITPNNQGVPFGVTANTSIEKVTIGGQAAQNQVDFRVLLV